MQQVFPNANELYTATQDQFVIVEIEQQLRKGEKWETNIGFVRSVLHNDEWKDANERALLITEISSRLVQIGDRILMKTKVSPIRNPGNPGEFDARYYWLSKGVRYQCFGFANQTKLLDSQDLSLSTKILNTIRNYVSTLFDKHIGNEQSAMVKAIFLGDKSDLDLETKNSFANAGAMHVLAVSGLHVGIITLILLWIFNHIFIGIKRNKAIVFLIVLLWGYAFITGFSASVTRSVLMFSLLGIAQISGKINNPINTLAFSALVLLVWSPIYIFDIGFQLSYLAVLGIFLTYSQIEKLVFLKNKQLQWLWQGTAVGIAAQIFTIPISLYYFHQFPNYFILSNISVMLFSGVILTGTIALVVFGKVPFVNWLIGVGLYFAASVLIETISWVEKLPGAVALGFDVPIFLMLIIYVVIILILFDPSKLRKVVWLVLLLPVILMLQLPRIRSLQKNEICVFNSKSTIVMAKIGNEQVCVFKGNERSKNEALSKVKDYQKINPGNVKYIELGNQNIQMANRNEKIEIKSARNSILFKIGNSRTVRIVTSNYYDSNDTLSDEVYFKGGINNGENQNNLTNRALKIVF